MSETFTRMNVGKYTIDAVQDSGGDLVIYLAPGHGERVTCVQGWTDTPRGLNPDWAKIRVTVNNADNIDPMLLRPGQSVTQ